MDLSSKDTTLNCCTYCNGFIWIDVLVRVLTSHLFDKLSDCRHPCRTSYKKYPVDVLCCKLCIFHCLIDRHQSLIYQVSSHLLELRPCKVDINVLWLPVGICGDEREVDVGGRYTRKLNLCFLSCIPQTLQCCPVLGEIDTFIFLELFNKIIYYPLVKVISTKMSVSTG